MTEWYCLKKPLALPLTKPLRYMDSHGQSFPVVDGFLESTTSIRKAWSAVLKIRTGGRTRRIMAAYLADMQGESFGSVSTNRNIRENIHSL